MTWYLFTWLLHDSHVTLKQAILVPRLLWNRASQDRLSSFPEEFPDTLASLRVLLVNSAKVGSLSYFYWYWCIAASVVPGSRGYWRLRMKVRSEALVPSDLVLAAMLSHVTIQSYTWLEQSDWDVDFSAWRYTFRLAVSPDPSSPCEGTWQD